MAHGEVAGREKTTTTQPVSPESLWRPPPALHTCRRLCDPTPFVHQVFTEPRPDPEREHSTKRDSAPALTKGAAACTNTKELTQFLPS